MNEESKITLREKLKSERAKYRIKTKDIAVNIGKSTAVISYIENSAESNSRFKYLKYLRSKGVDLNSLFDEIL